MRPFRACSEMRRWNCGTTSRAPPGPARRRRRLAAPPPRCSLARTAANCALAYPPPRAETLWHRLRGADRTQRVPRGRRSMPLALRPAPVHSRGKDRCYKRRKGSAGALRKTPRLSPRRDRLSPRFLVQGSWQAPDPPCIVKTFQPVAARLGRLKVPSSDGGGIGTVPQSQLSAGGAVSSRPRRGPLAARQLRHARPAASASHQ
jgi:hypothetical protein